MERLPISRRLLRIHARLWKRMYMRFLDLDDGSGWGLEVDRFVNVRVFLKISDLDLETKQITNTRDFILTEDNMEELKKMIEDSKG